jgi:tight adherence protein C
LLGVLEWRAMRARRTIGRAIDGSPGPTTDAGGEDRVRAPHGRVDPARRSDAELPAHWLLTRWGRLFVADEDRRLIDQCGLPAVPAQLALLVVRLVLALGLPVLAWGLMQAGWLPRRPTVVIAIAMLLGFMLPKWLLARQAAARRARVATELPLFVDLLRLLQGVGLSLDQSLQIMATDFQAPLRVLGQELVIANRQYSQGRTRDHSLQRLATLHQNEHLAGLVSLIVQVARHGGAVQEPLAQYSDRLREHRRSELKARIGKITVKMTGVMVTTLLPALVIVTAGPGFLAVTRSLGALSK